MIDGDDHVEHLPASVRLLRDKSDRIVGRCLNRRMATTPLCAFGGFWQVSSDVGQQGRDIRAFGEQWEQCTGDRNRTDRGGLLARQGADDAQVPGTEHPTLVDQDCCGAVVTQSFRSLSFACNWSILAAFSGQEAARLPCRRLAQVAMRQ